jgi:hypothetical protein
VRKRISPQYSRRFQEKEEKATMTWLVFYMTILFPMLVLILIVMDHILPADSSPLAAKSRTIRSHRPDKRRTS